jgi:hypothetical protein
MLIGIRSRPNPGLPGMEPQLSRTQLDQVIAEAQRLTEYRQDELLDPEQVREILQELNLPPAVLEDALAQVHRRQALEQQTRQRKRIVGIVGVVVAVAIAIPLFLTWQNRQDLGRVSAQQDRIALSAEGGQPLKSVDRQSNPEVYYRVTLKDAPIGKKLSLSCDWIDPKGQVVKQNRYETQAVTTTVWTTHCRHRIGPTALTGTWSAKIFLDGRPIDTEAFDVK